MKKLYVLFMVMAVVLSACSIGRIENSSSIVEGNSEEIHLLSSKETLETVLTALKEADSTTFNRYVIYPEERKGIVLYKDNILFGDNLDGESKEYVQAVIEYMTFEIDSILEDGNNAIIECNISNRDLSNVDLIKYSDADNPLIEAIKNTKNNQISFNVSISLQKDEEIWKVVVDDSLRLAISGGHW